MPPLLLPGDERHGFAGDLGGLADPANPPAPPAYGALSALLAPDDDLDRFFLATEKQTAAWLRARGVAIRSVQPRAGELERTPDAVIDGLGLTLEIKSARSRGAIVRALRTGRGQSRRVVVDVRGTGVGRADVADAINEALRKFGQHLDEVLVIYGRRLGPRDGLGVSWWHGSH